ncbi:MAG: transporter [Actinomycetia bacterium]|jgi:lipooligosaccharide transport system permease protein|nr:transporter [Actinomycetes bacterium]
MVYRRTWLTIVSGFFEPLFYLFSLGIGLGHFVGHVNGVSYAAFIAPALLASSAMNGAVYDSTINVFWKLRIGRVYDAMLVTPVGPNDVAMGEVGWALFRGLLYSTGFIITAAALGLLHSWWGLLALPSTIVIGFGFAGIGMAAATFMRSWQDFDLIQLVQLPMFLFSTTFYPLSVYPAAVQWIVRFSPLYHAIELIRSLTLGTVGAASLVHLGYLVLLGTAGMAVARRRMAGLLLS